MRKALSKETKQAVANRADYRCEYCLLSEKVSFYNFHVEHIKSIKHGGLSDLLNLAYSCPDCNHFKGSDIGSFSGDDEAIIRFFNPRKDIWHEHFECNDGCIYGKTDIGKTTERIFKFNETDRLIFRRQLTALGLYP